MKIRGYLVAILDEKEVPYKFYDGTGYTENPHNARLFTEGQVNVARSEQGNHQRLVINEEVRLIKFAIDLPFDEREAKKETPVLSTARAALGSVNDTLAT